MRFLVHAATPCVDVLSRALEDAQQLVEHAAACTPLYADALARTHTLVPGHLLNTPPLYADALARTHNLVPGHVLNMPPLLTSTHRAHLGARRT